MKLVIGKQLALAIALSASLRAESLTGFINRISADVVSTGRVDMSAYDSASPGSPHTVKLCWDDPTFSANCDSVISTGGIAYNVPATVGAVSLRDGRQHTLYAKIVSTSNPGAGDVILSGSAWPYRYTAGVLGPMWTANLEAAPARGISPATLAVFANAQDVYSVGSAGAVVCVVNGTSVKDDGVAGYYVRKYGIPCGNVRVISTAVTPNMSLANFNSQILPSVTALPASLQGIAVGWVQPVLVAGTYSNSVAAMMASGVFHSSLPTYAGCGGDYLAVNPYFNSSSKAPFTDYGLRPTMMLVGEKCPTCLTNSYIGPYTEDFSAFKRMVDAAYAARDTNPSGGRVDWAITSDLARSVAGRVASPLSLGAALSPFVNARILGSLTAPSPLDISDTNILVYAAGAPHPLWGGSSVKPGAAAVWATTSSSGNLPFDGNQTPISYYLANGAVGTYGTVAEPCVSIVRKFPDPAVFVPHYTQGQTMAEALWKSVYFPWAGAFAGDPLASPFSLRAAAAAPPPQIAANGIVNGASFLAGPATPGNVLAIFGTNLGPTDTAGLTLDSGGAVSTSAGGTRVLIDGTPAPILYANAGQVGAVTPFGVPANANAQVAVEYLGVASAPVTMAVADAAPALFTVDASGSGQGAILNQDTSLNAQSNPAAKGSVVVLYATGAGLTNPPSVDGQLTAGANQVPLQPVSVTIGGQAATVNYAGAAPGLVAGLLQVNAVVPMGIASGSLLVVVKVGSAVSQGNVTVAVQ